jgi:hypothetical protein
METTAMDSDDDDIRKTLDLIDAMAVNAPSALHFLIITAINELRGAVDEGHANAELLRDVTAHAINISRMLPHTPTH